MGKNGKKDSWFKPNFWTLAYLDEATRPRGKEQPITFGAALRRWARRWPRSGFLSF